MMSSSHIEVTISQDDFVAPNTTTNITTTEPKEQLKLKHDHHSRKNGATVVLGSAKTVLSSSVVWELQSSFYSDLTVSAWSQAIVPNFVTTNAFVAMQYAKLILAFVVDWYDMNLDTPHSHSQPVYIVEVGAGHGKMGFLIVTQLLRMRKYWPTRRHTPATAATNTTDDWLPFKYIMTDFTQGNLEFWRTHPPLQELFTLGLMDVALFDAEHDTQLHLQHSGETLTRGSFNTPIIAIFNYVFDTLRHDAFRASHGQLFEGLCTVRVPTSDAETLEPSQLISKLRFSWDYEPLTDPLSTSSSSPNPEATPTTADTQVSVNSTTTSSPVSYYDDESLNRVLEQYLNETNSIDKQNTTQSPEHNTTSSPPSSNDLSLLMPVGGIQAIRNLRHLSSDRVVVLAGDKAYNHQSEMHGLRDPHVAVHGSFSFMVNFDAFRRFTQVEGGFALSTKHKDGFKCIALVLVQKTNNEQDDNNTSKRASTDESVWVDRNSSCCLDEDYRSTDAVNVTDKQEKKALLLCQPSDLPELALQWKDSVEVFGPDSFSTLQRSIKEEIHSPSLKLVMSLVRLSNYDPDVFFKFKQTVIDKAPHASERTQSDLKRDVGLIHANFYPLQQNKDVPFELGRLMMGFKDYKAAVALFADSQRHCGEHHVSWYNMGICYHHSKELPSALRCFKRSLSLRPDYHDARNWATRVEAAALK